VVAVTAAVVMLLSAFCAYGASFFTVRAFMACFVCVLVYSAESVYMSAPYFAFPSMPFPHFSKLCFSSKAFLPFSTGSIVFYLVIVQKIYWLMIVFTWCVINLNVEPVFYISELCKLKLIIFNI
jgi:hypothetical protein